MMLPLATVFLNLCWGVILGSLTFAVYHDSNYANPGWVALHAISFGVALVAGIVATILLALRKRRSSTVAFSIAALFVAIAVLPALEFAWTAFAGFGGKFFFGWVLPAVIVFAALYAAAAREAFRQKDSNSL
ncbi:MAG: hypothetical protein HY261_00630 [Chloroflexi bacterium]|nr:hypothetical protein [Chloroflexota bacterium]